MKQTRDGAALERTGGSEQAWSSDFERTGGSEQARCGRTAVFAVFEEPASPRKLRGLFEFLLIDIYMDR